MLVATFTLTNCTEDLQPVQDAEKTPYTIVATPADTKTVNDGFATKWTAGDELNVFHAETGSAIYSTNSQFILSDASTGAFTTAALNGELSAVNDWFVLYPYMKYESTPVKSAYTPVGSSASAKQEQTGNDNMKHIAGSNYPMWGVATAVSGDKMPHITMTHLSSLVEVTVKNATAEGLVVTSVSLTAEEDIVGTYHINFSTLTPGFTPSGDKYVSKTANLKVVEGEAIAQNAEGKFYFAIKPFTAAAGETLTLMVNGVEKKITLSTDAVFAPGKIKKLNFNYDKEPEPEVEENLGFALVKDASKLVVGDEIVIVAKDVDFAMGADKGSNRDQAAVTRTNSDVNIEWTTDVQVLTLEAGATDGTFAFNTGAGYLYAASSKSNHLKTKAELDANGSWLITVEADGTATVKSQGEYTRNWLRYNSNNSIFSCYASGQGDIVIYRNNDSRKALATPTVNTPVVTGNSVTLTWGAVDNATGYNIIYGTDGNTVVESTTGTSISIANLSWNTTYEFVVVAKADVGSSSFRDSAFSEAVYAEIGSDPNASVPTESYVLVTNSSALAAGDKVVIVCPAKNMIMGAQSGSYRTGVAVTINDDAIASLPAGAVELTLENGTESGTFAMKASDGYLYWDSSNSVKTGNTSYNWNISIADDVTSITSAATPERKLQWNASSPRFACYTSNQTAVSIFKLTSN